MGQISNQMARQNVSKTEVKENIIFPNLWDAAKAHVRVKFMLQMVVLRKNVEINNLTSQHKELEKKKLSWNLEEEGNSKEKPEISKIEKRINNITLQVMTNSSKQKQKLNWQCFNYINWEEKEKTQKPKWEMEEKNTTTDNYRNT